MAELDALDLVVYGATGFTGTLVAKYLGETLRHGSVRWALAGRDVAKLEQVREQLVSIDPKWRELPLLQADAGDRDSLHRMAERAKVVLSTVGPFERYGEPLVQACVEERAHYVDITGEPGFWRRMIERYDAAARAAEVLVVSCCGFDSIPFDLGVWYTLGELRKQCSAEEFARARVRGYVSAQGTVSGGTWASAVEAMGNLRCTPADPDAPKHRALPHYSRALHRFALPLPTVDPLVVRRTASLRSDYPEHFQYEHFVQSRSPIKLGLLSLGAVTVAGLAQIPSTRQWLLGLKPSGAGPDDTERQQGRFRVTFFGEAGRHHVTTRVTGHDPGYDHTSKMVAEAALTLLEDRDRLPHRGGVLTPASAMAEALRPRLERTGMRFETVATS